VSIADNFWASSAITGTKILKKAINTAHKSSKVINAENHLGKDNRPILNLPRKFTTGAPSNDKTADISIYAIMPWKYHTASATIKSPPIKMIYL
jgi:hypothetical protein